MGLVFIWNSQQFAGTLGGGAVTSVFGRTGDVLSNSGDYTASQITFTPSGNISAVTAQLAIQELDSEKLDLSHAGSGGAAHALVTTSVAGFLSAADKVKLDGIAAGATANQTDAFLLARANHTGTQLASTISDFTAASRSASVQDALVDGVIDIAPSQNAVVDALALKSNVGHTHVAANISDFTSAAQAAVVVDAINDGVTATAPSQNAVFDALATKTDLGHTHVLANVTDVTITVSQLNAIQSGLDYPGHFHASDRMRANHTGTQLASTISDFSSAADARIAAQKGVANGIAELDSGGKVPLSQLPSSIMNYLGVWNASTNSPVLADGVGDSGDLYRVGTAGTQNLGSGNITFDIGDYVIYNGSFWEKSDNTDAVSSVNGYTGSVVLVKADVGLGNVDNTSDLNKPISTATQTALDLKADKATTISTTAPLTGGGDLSTNRTFAINQATTIADGYLSATDFNTFNDKIASAVNLGITGARVFESQSGTALQFRRIVAGSNISVTENANDISISSSAPPAGDGDVITSTTGVNISNGTDRLFGAANLSINIDTASGSGPGLLSAADFSTFNSKIGGATNLGASGSSVFSSVSGTNLQFRKLIAGTNITITENTNDITFDVATFPAGDGDIVSATTGVSISNGADRLFGATNVSIDIQTANSSQPGLLSAADFTSFAAKLSTTSNLGAGSQVAAGISGTTAQFRSLSAGTGINLTQNTNDIVIAAGAVTVDEATFTGSSVSLTAGVKDQYRIFTGSADTSIASLPTPSIVTELTIINDTDFNLTIESAASYSQIVLQKNDTAVFIYSINRSKWFLKG
jgi:hypothetical protein